MPAAISPDIVCSAIDELTTKSQKCKGPANQISIVNVALAVSGFGPLPFVQVHQDLLNILIGKAGLVPNLLPFVGPPLAQVLKQMESVVDTLAFELIDLIPDNAADATSQKNSLDETLAKSIESWNGGITVI